MILRGCLGDPRGVFREAGDDNDDDDDDDDDDGNSLVEP